MACFGSFWASCCGDCLDVTAYSSGVFILLQTDFTTETGQHVYSYLKFSSQVYHRPIMPHTKFIHFNVTRTVTSSVSGNFLHSFVHALEKVGWTCLPQSTLWRRPWVCYTRLEVEHSLNVKGEWVVICTVLNGDIADDVGLDLDPFIPPPLLPYFTFQVFLHTMGRWSYSLQILYTGRSY